MARTSTTPSDDYPAFCVEAALRTLGDPGGLGHRDRRLAATASRSPPTRSPAPAARWRGASRPRQLARQHNNAQVIGIGARMHTVDEALAIVDAFIGTAVVERRASPASHRHPRRIRAHRHATARCLARRTRVRVPEGHTLHRLARLHQRKFAGAPVDGQSSPQGRFAAVPRSSTVACCRRASAYGKHLFHRYGDGPIVHVHLGLYGAFADARWCRCRCRSVQVRMRIGRRRLSAPTCAGRRPARCSTTAEVDALIARLGPDPLRKDADPDAGLGADRRSQRADRWHC